MQLDLQSLFGLQEYRCTHQLATRNLPPPPSFGLTQEGAIGQPRQTTSLCDPLAQSFSSGSFNNERKDKEKQKNIVYSTKLFITQGAMFIARVAVIRFNNYFTKYSCFSSLCKVDLFLMWHTADLYVVVRSEIIRAIIFSVVKDPRGARVAFEYLEYI